MAYDIGPKIGIDGEAEFRRELSDIKTGIKTLGSEMKLVTATYDDNADSMEALAAKTEVLTKTYGEQEKYLKKTEIMLEEAKKKYGENSSEVQKWQKAVYEAETELRKTANELKKAGEAMDELADDTGEAEEAMEGLGDAAEKSSKSMSAVAATAAGGILAGAASAAVGAVTDLAKTVWDLDESTEEYRVAQGKLTTAFGSAAMGADVAKKTYTELYKIVGDTDTAAEAASMMAQLADNVDNLGTWTDIAAGAWGTFGDALPINSLMEAALETKMTGQITGALADALNWAGVQEEDFQAKLDACSSESERNRLIMDTLSETYSDATDIFYTNNAEIVRSRENQARLDESTARLGESIGRLKNTLLEQFGPAIADAADWLADLTVDISEGLGPAMDEMGEIARTCFDGIEGFWDSEVRPAVEKVKGWLADVKNEATAAKRAAAGFGNDASGGSFGGAATGAATAKGGGKTYNNSAGAEPRNTTKVYLDSSEIGRIFEEAERKNDVMMW